MATAAIIGLRTGKRLLNIPRYQSDLADNFPMNDHKSLQFSQAPTKNNIVAKRLSHLRHAIKALKELVDTSSPLSNGNFDVEASLEVLVSLQKSMLEKQWELSFDQVESGKKKAITCSGISARQRRINTRRKFFDPSRAKEIRPKICPRLLETRLRGYLRGTVSDDLLAHAEVVELSNKIQCGLSLEDKRLKLKKEVGYEISDKQLASSLRISRAELQSKLVEFSLAREKLAMSNVRLVMSIAQKYDNLGAEMADLIQGGLIGLLRGIEKFDSSKGFKISTYVYWWIRQKLSEILNMSQQKVRNATEAVNKVISLDSEAFPSLNGLPTETFHSYIPDNNLENNPWHGFEEWSLKDEVNKLLCATLGARERDIIRLYYGMGNECHTWEDISKQTRYGLSRERVRRVGLVAMEKLKQAARKRKLDAMLVKH